MRAGADAICHGLHVSLELKTTLAESSWKIGDESIALERWTRKALIFRKLVCELAVLRCSTQKMLNPMAKMGRFVHPCCDDEVKILQNAALAIEPSFRTDEITQGR